MLGTILRVLPIVFPVVVSAVKLVEKLFGGGRGGEKKEMVVEIVKAVILATEGFANKDLVIDEKAFAESVGDIVDAVVKLLNATGQFNKDNV